MTRFWPKKTSFFRFGCAKNGSTSAKADPDRKRLEGLVRFRLAGAAALVATTKAPPSRPVAWSIVGILHLEQGLTTLQLQRISSHRPPEHLHSIASAPLTTIFGRNRSIGMGELWFWARRAFRSANDASLASKRMGKPSLNAVSHDLLSISYQRAGRPCRGSASALNPASSGSPRSTLLNRHPGPPLFTNRTRSHAFIGRSFISDRYFQQGLAGSFQR